MSWKFYFVLCWNSILPCLGYSSFRQVILAKLELFREQHASFALFLFSGSMQHMTEMAWKTGQKDLCPTNPDLATMLGDMDIDFDKSDLFYVFVFQISRFPHFGISRFLDVYTDGRGGRGMSSYWGQVGTSARNQYLHWKNNGSAVILMWEKTITDKILTTNPIRIK